MNKTKHFYITTPIYYVNDLPHLGHLYTTLAADVLARFKRKRGKDVFFLTGTDEHGAKVEAAAKEIGLSPKDFADKVSREFKRAWQDFKIEFDDFARTTDPSHEQKVKDFLIELKKRNWLYQGEYEGLYCRECEEYKQKKELKGGLCPVHKTKVEEVKEPVWFFKLSQFQKKLQALIGKKTLLIEPEGRRQEVLAFLKDRLQDVAISRSKVSWGIPLPWAQNQTVYVWVDALLNYWTFAKKGYWPADLHLIGKDILRFHAIIWPSLLLARDLPLPRKIFVHGFFTVNGEKMSKTQGNVITPRELRQKFGLEASRYLVFSAFPFGQNGDFSWERLSLLYKAELQNGLGNLLQRTVTLLQRSKVKPALSKNGISCAEADGFLEKLNFYRALKAIYRIVGEANRYIDKSKPWQLLKSRDFRDKNKLKGILISLTRRIETISAGLSPFMPNTSVEILKQLKNQKPRVLFPSIR